MFDTIKRWMGTQGGNESGEMTLADFMRSSIARKNGQIINPRTILKHPGVWRGVDLISTNVAKVPFDVYQREADGSRRSAGEYDTYFLLKRQPNWVYSRFQLIKCWVVNTLTHGDGFIFIRRDNLGRPMALFLLDSAATSIHAGQFGVYYTTTDADGIRRRLDASEVAHLRGLGNDGISGLRIAEVLADAFGLGLTLQRYQNLFFENSGRPSVVIKLPETVSSREEAEEFREAWGDVHGGPENAFKPAMLMPGADVTMMQNDNAIESLANLREHDLVTIANCLGIPPHRIGAKSVSVSYGSLEQENLSFIQDIDGWITQAEQELSLKLLRTSEQGTHYIEGTREALVQSDSKTKAELLALYRRNGMMSDEQIARKLNLKREAGGTYWVEANLIERDRALAEPEPTPEPAPDRELSLKLTNSIVGRLSRRAAKSGKLEINLWQEELGDLPGFVAAADYLENNPIDQFKTETITGLLWTTN
jgi:HK97 family phage portal protein